MTDKIILTCIAIFFPLALVVINKLIDRTEIKKKDAEITSLKKDINSYASKAENAQKAEKVAQTASQLISSASGSQINNSRTFSDLREEAKHVETLDDALDLARRQVEANR